MPSQAKDNYTKAAALAAVSANADSIENASSVLQSAHLSKTCAILVDKFSSDLPLGKLRDHVQAEVPAYKTTTGQNHKGNFPAVLHQRVQLALQMKQFKGP